MHKILRLCFYLMIFGASQTVGAGDHVGVVGLPQKNRIISQAEKQPELPQDQDEGHLADNDEYVQEEYLRPANADTRHYAETPNEVRAIPITVRSERYTASQDSVVCPIDYQAPRQPEVVYYDSCPPRQASCAKWLVPATVAGGAVGAGVFAANLRSPDPQDPEEIVNVTFEFQLFEPLEEKFGDITFDILLNGSSVFGLTTIAVADGAVTMGPIPGATSGDTITILVVDASGSTLDYDFVMQMFVEGSLEDSDNFPYEITSTSPTVTNPPLPQSFTFTVP